MATILTSVVVAPEQLLITRKPLPTGVIVNSNNVHIGKVVTAGAHCTYYQNCIVGYRASPDEVIEFVLNNVTYFIVPVGKVLFGIAP